MIKRISELIDSYENLSQCTVCYKRYANTYRAYILLVDPFLMPANLFLRLCVDCLPVVISKLLNPPSSGSMDGAKLLVDDTGISLPFSGTEICKIKLN